jgi:hypothetical protein
LQQALLQHCSYALWIILWLLLLLLLLWCRTSLIALLLQLLLLLLCCCSGQFCCRHSCHGSCCCCRHWLVVQHKSCIRQVALCWRRGWQAKQELSQGLLPCLLL